MAGFENSPAPHARARKRERKEKNERERESSPFRLCLTLDQEVAEARAGVRAALDRVRGPLGLAVLDRAAELGRHRARLVGAGGGLGDGRGRGRGGGAGAGHCVGVGRCLVVGWKEGKKGLCFRGVARFFLSWWFGVWLVRGFFGGGRGEEVGKKKNVDKEKERELERESGGKRERERESRRKTKR